jgi:hypothetical protein
MTVEQTARPTTTPRAGYEALLGRVESILGERNTRLLEVVIAQMGTQLDPEGLNKAVAGARDAGVSRDELQKILEINALLGLQSPVNGPKILRPMLEQRGELDTSLADTDIAKQVRERIFGNADWRNSPPPPAFESFLDIDAELVNYMFDIFEATDTGDPRFFSYLCIASCGVPSHFHELGLQYRVNQALDRGITPVEVLAVLSLCSNLGLRMLDLGESALDAVYGSDG